jgi:hypothetical protein
MVFKLPMNQYYQYGCRPGSLQWHEVHIDFRENVSYTYYK